MILRNIVSISSEWDNPQRRKDYLTVGDLIHDLEKMNKMAKVVLYRRNGSLVYPTSVIADSPHIVAIF